MGRECGASRPGGRHARFSSWTTNSFIIPRAPNTGFTPITSNWQESSRRRRFPRRSGRTKATAACSGRFRDQPSGWLPGRCIASWSVRVGYFSIEQENGVRSSPDPFAKRGDCEKGSKRHAHFCPASEFPPGCSSNPPWRSGIPATISGRLLGSEPGPFCLLSFKKRRFFDYLSAEWQFARVKHGNKSTLNPHRIPTASSSMTILR